MEEIEIEISNDELSPETDDILPVKNEFLVCPECSGSSALEIVSFDEDTNIFEFKCTKKKP